MHLDLYISYIYISNLQQTHWGVQGEPAAQHSVASPVDGRAERCDFRRQIAGAHQGCDEITGAVASDMHIIYTVCVCACM